MESSTQIRPFATASRHDCRNLGGLTDDSARARVQETHGIGGGDWGTPDYDGGSDYVSFTQTDQRIADCGGAECFVNQQYACWVPTEEIETVRKRLD